MTAASPAMPREPASRRIRKLGNIAVVLVFLVGILLPMLHGMEAGDDLETRKVELRELATEPALPADWNALCAYPVAYEHYFDDHFGFRPQLVQAYMHIKANWFGLSPSKLVLLGTDGWLYFTKGRSMEDHRGELRLSPGAPAQWLQALLDRRRWLLEHGATYLFAVAPNKESVHPERLPPRHRQAREVQHRVDQIRDHVERNSDFRILDLREPMRELAKTEPAFLVTDSHWTEEAAFLGYTEVMQRLRTLGIDKAPLPRTRFRTETRQELGDLARMLPTLAPAEETRKMLVPNEPLPCRRIEVPEYLRSAPKGWNQIPALTMYECPDQQGVLLMFKDSFAHQQMPWFACHFRYSIFLSMFPQDLEPFQVLVNGLRPTVVIEQRVERNLYEPPGRLETK